VALLSSKLNIVDVELLNPANLQSLWEPFSVTACYRVNGHSLILSEGKWRQISRNVLNFQRYNAITNRLLYQLSYVGAGEAIPLCHTSFSIPAGRSSRVNVR
jgi:hypothetical protein